MHFVIQWSALVMSIELESFAQITPCVFHGEKLKELCNVELNEIGEGRNDVHSEKSASCSSFA